MSDKQLVSERFPPGSKILDPANWPWARLIIQVIYVAQAINREYVHRELKAYLHGHHSPSVLTTRELVEQLKREGILNLAPGVPACLQLTFLGKGIAKILFPPKDDDQTTPSPKGDAP